MNRARPEDDGPIFQRSLNNTEQRIDAESPLAEVFQRLRQPIFETLNREGYFQAGCQLSDMLVHPQSPTAAFVGAVFPMAFCFRHYVELAIKSAIHGASRVTGVAPSEVTHKAHDLSKLWDELVHQLQFRSEDASRTIPEHHDDSESIRIVGKYVHELHGYGDQLFRYMLDSKGKTTIDRLPILDSGAIIRLRAKMRELHNFFNGLEAYLDVLKDRSQC